MQNQLKKVLIPKEIQEEENKNADLPSSDEENSENPDQDDSPKVNIASFITTPYERVLSIINEAKTFILSLTSTQQELIKGLDWAIKVISSHNLYAYELKDEEASKENEQSEDFKQFVKFVNSYNNEIDNTNKKQTGKGKSFLISSLNLKRPSALKYSLHKVEEEKEQKNIEEKTDNKNEKKRNSHSHSHNIKIKEEKNTNSKNKANTNANNSNLNSSKKTEQLKSAGKNNKKILKTDKNENSKNLKNSKNIKSKKKMKPLSPIRPIKKYINEVLAQKTEEKEKAEKKMSLSKANKKQPLPKKNNLLQSLKKF